MMFSRTRTLLACGFSVSVGVAHSAQAQTAGGGLLDHYVLYGVNDADQLIRYTFADAKFESIGTVQDGSGAIFSGIHGAAHVPDNLNLFGFYTDPTTNETRLLYINSETAEAQVMGQSLGPGQVTGATISWKDSDGELDEGGDQITGKININPNNSPSNEFKLIKPDSTQITRDDLHQDSPVDASGMYYQGPAHYVRVRPKGSGSQSDLYVFGTSYDIQNDHTYVLSGGTMDVKIYNDHINGSGKAMGYWWMEILDAGSAVIHEGGDTFGYQGLFALQNIESTEEVNVAFDIIDDTVVPLEDFAAKVTVLGAAINAGGAYDVPVTTEITIGTTPITPFGAFDKAVSANVNDDHNPRKHILPSIYPAGTPITVAGRSWLKKHSWHSGKKNFHWNTYLTVTSNTNPDNLLVLRHGDSVPNIDQFMSQSEILDFVMDYVDQDTGTVILDENQAIFLYELGTTNLGSSAADFQDLIVLVTLAKDPADLEDEDDDDDAAAGPASRLVKVHSITGGFEQIMTLDRVYDGLAASHNGLFYAAHDGQLYELNPYEQTETLLGSMPDAQMTGLEFAGPTLCGFTMIGDQLYPMDFTTGAAIGSGMNLSTQDLGTIIFMEEDNLPASLAAFD